jgi:hypothetical protein
VQGAHRRQDQRGRAASSGDASVLRPEPRKEFGASVPQRVAWQRLDKAEEVAPVFAFVASKPASHVAVAPYTMGSEWKRESAAAQYLTTPQTRRWHGNPHSSDA